MKTWHWVAIGLGVLMITGKTIIDSMIPKDVVLKIKTALIRMGINNSMLIAGIISEIWTESKFIPKSEKGYGNTANERIRKIFGTKVSSLSEDQLTALKKDDVKFFDFVYGGWYGNEKAGDGYKYRGRGLNQLTFKGNYRKFGQLIGKDLVSNPDLVNDLDTAIMVMAAFFGEGYKSMPKATTYTPMQAARTALQINAGVRKNLDTPFYQEVLSKQLEVMPEIVKLV